MTKRWKKKPKDSTWGDFGEDDQIGRLHLITPQRRLAAAKEIKEGLTFILSLPLDIPGGKGLFDGRKGPQLFPGVLYDTPLEDVMKSLSGKAPPPGCMDLGCDDGVTMFLQYSTQWDALCHVGAMFDADDDGESEHCYYNGWRGATDMITPDQGGPYAKKLGIENMASTGVQGRGVLVDLTIDHGFDRKVLSFDDLARAMDKQKVVVEPGDMLCLRTGFTEVMLDMGDNLDRDKMNRTGVIMEGGDPKLQKFVIDSGIVAICADNLAVEAELGSTPFALEKGYTLMPLHHLCLFKLGVHIGELWYFRELAKWLKEHNRNRFFLTAPPLNLPGSVGSPSTPVATV